jgi:DNA-binding response OmpR family regulator
MANGFKTTILVAGDDLEDGGSLRAVISRDDVAIVEKPMTQAIEAFRDIGPDLVVLIFSDERARTRDDVREARGGETEDPLTPGAAPDLDPEGLRACFGIRQSVRGEHVPILVGMDPDVSNTGAIERIYEIGATDVAIRPFNWPIVARRVGSLLEDKRVIDALLRCEARFAGAQRMAKMGTWEYDRASGRVEASEELHRLLSVPPGSLHTLEDLLGRPFR